MSNLTNEKIERFAEWMKGDHVLVHLDPHRAGVEVPAHLKNSNKLTLKLSYLFQGVTTHDADGISTHLKFNGQYQHCFIPWDAIWGLTSEHGENFVWMSELPENLFNVDPTLESEEAPAAPPKLSVVGKKSARTTPVLKRIK